jgi:hypothetical protein
MVFVCMQAGETSTKGLFVFQCDGATGRDSTRFTEEAILMYIIVIVFVRSLLLLLFKLNKVSRPSQGNLLYTLRVPMGLVRYLYPTVFDGCIVRVRSRGGY